MSDLITRERAIRNLNALSTSAAENQMLDAIIAAVSEAIARFCRREFVAKDYDELYSGQGECRLFLRNYPILAVQSVRSGPATVLSVTNTDTATNQQARVAVTSTGLVLTRVASGTATVSTLTFASNATLQALATAISTLGSGWTATVAGSSGGDYGLWPSQELYVPPLFGDGPNSMGNLGCRGQWAGLSMHVDELADYAIDHRGWLIGAGGWTMGVNNLRVQYTAGYMHVPEDVQEACAQWTAATFWQSKRDPGLRSDSIPGAVSRMPFSRMPPGVFELLIPYRHVGMGRLGG